MATSETTNLQLVKYGAGTDNFIRTDYNGNLDKIDTFAGNTNEAIANLIKKTSVSIWSSESINAGSQKYKWLSIANACPSGYVPIGVALECSNVKCIANFVDGLSSSPYLTAGTICVHNLNSGSNEAVDVNLIITCMKA